MKDKFINLYLIFSCLIEIKKTRHKKKKKPLEKRKFRYLIYPQKRNVKVINKNVIVYIF